MLAHRVRIVIGVTMLAACATPQIGRSGGGVVAAPTEVASEPCLLSTGDVTTRPRTITIGLTEPVDPRHAPIARGRVVTSDRKSTRLNSSHLGISYAVFCLKKKKGLQQP